MNRLNKDSIKLLREKFKDDNDVFQLIQDCLYSFAEYYSAIYRMETYKLLFGYDNTSREDYQNELMFLDRSRTMAHNEVISNIRILNKLCEQYSIPPVYDEVISTEKPYRVKIADAVLAYVKNEIENREK